MFVDRISPRDIRGSMQNLYGTFLIGVGGIAGGIISGLANDLLTTKPGETTLRELLGIASQAGVIIAEKDHSLRDWTLLWGVCGVLAFLCLVGFWVAFPSESPPSATDEQAPGEG